MCKRDLNDYGTITLIGDVHGKILEYLDLVAKFPYTVQLGDMGFKRQYDEISHLSMQHRVILGNHDDPNCEFKHSLGDFGLHVLNGVGFFFVRGAESIDKQWRTEGVDYFRNEELNYSQSYECLKQYELILPNLVLTHTAPSSILNKLVDNIFSVPHTSNLLQALFELHQPSLWVFGHWHQSKQITVGKTKFVCLNELETLTIDGEGNEKT